MQTNPRNGVIPNKIVMEDPIKTPMTFLDRLNREKSELDEKLDKLKLFMESDNFNKIDAVQKSLLQIQVHSMLMYSQILFERLQWLSTPKTEEEANHP